MAKVAQLWHRNGQNAKNAENCATAVPLLPVPPCAGLCHQTVPPKRNDTNDFRRVAQKNGLAQLIPAKHYTRTYAHIRARARTRVVDGMYF